MQKVKVKLKERSYDIEIGNGNLWKTDFSKFGNRFAIISGRHVSAIYGKKLLALLKKQGLSAQLFTFPGGEKSKNPEMAIKIGRELAKNKIDKSSVIIALGGGVTGDLAGFIASFYERGIDFIQIPTTLLAMTDSSIGGKTGVDIPEGKNMFGTFYQPKKVIIDTSVLKTLPKEEFGNGYAEIIKYGMTIDAKLFKALESSPRSDLGEIIKRSCEIKASIVEKDEKEGELRKVLNYGHTIGHAIEVAENFKVPHGAGVALGMIYEGKIAVALGLLNNNDYQQQISLIKKFGLPTSYKGNVNKLINLMKGDKKNKDGKIYFILPTRIGSVKKSAGKVAFAVEENIIKKCL